MVFGPSNLVPRRITANLQHPLPSLSLSPSLLKVSVSRMPKSSPLSLSLHHFSIISPSSSSFSSRDVVLFGCIWPLVSFKIPPNLGNGDLAFPRKLLAILGFLLLLLLSSSSSKPFGRLFRVNDDDKKINRDWPARIQSRATGL